MYKCTEEEVHSVLILFLRSSQYKYLKINCTPHKSCCRCTELLCCTGGGGWRSSSLPTCHFIVASCMLNSFDVGISTFFHESGLCDLSLLCFVLYYEKITSCCNVACDSKMNPATMYCGLSADMKMLLVSWFVLQVNVFRMWYYLVIG